MILESETSKRKYGALISLNLFKFYVALVEHDEFVIKNYNF